MRAPGQYLELLRQMGPRWLLYRAGHAMRRRVGLLRLASPAVAWEQVPAPVLGLQLRAKRLAVPASWGIACVDEAEAILRGNFRLFSHQAVNAGFPPDWHRDQLMTKQATNDREPESDGPRPEVGGTAFSGLRHWTQISDSGMGDIKGVWELSRFSWAFPLARASVRTGDGRFAAAFWQLFSDWCHHNPPNLGPNWMCGQEATFRLMAVIFAAESIGVPEAHRPALARFIDATGRRIAANLGYALSQKNNHGISECIGLVTAALVLPGCVRSANWLAQGLRQLQKQLAELIYADGGFSQHSMIYHRVLLHDLCWCRWRLDLAGRRSPEWLDAAGKRALEYLMRLTDATTGQAPLYGSNDGANVLPLSDAEFLDLRPVIQMAAALFRGELPLPPGPWDEAAAWLKADWSSLPRRPWPAAPDRWHAPMAGCFQTVHGRDRLFLRCPTRFRHRPAQADMLHVDVWRGGRPITMDGGSFSYNPEERLNVLAAASQHNVLTVDGEEPMRKFSRFLYLPWPVGEAGEAGEGVFRASHNGYANRGIRWMREVSRGAPAGGFMVRDKVQGAAGHRLRWHWRLADAPWQQCEERLEVHSPDLDYRISWSGPAISRSWLLCADKTTAYGWWSPHYGSARPAVALLLEVEATGDFEMVTEFRPLE